jgi:5-formyltetrahydrofolate cyclo-ligase
MCFREASWAHYSNNDIPFAKHPLQVWNEEDSLLAEYPLVYSETFDVVVVPLVAFDEGFNRLGYGGGNYDRFLASLCNNAVIVGVAFTEQELSHVPIEAHDRPLPFIVSG